MQAGISAQYPAYPKQVAKYDLDQCVSCLHVAVANGRGRIELGSVHACGEAVG